MAITQVTGESGVHPGSLGGGKAACMTDRQPAKGADGGGCGGSAWHRSQRQSQW